MLGQDAHEFQPDLQYFSVFRSSRCAWICVVFGFKFEMSTIIPSAIIFMLFLIGRATSAECSSRMEKDERGRVTPGAGQQHGQARWQTRGWWSPARPPIAKTVQGHRDHA